MLPEYVPAGVPGATETVNHNAVVESRRSGSRATSESELSRDLLRSKIGTSGSPISPRNLAGVMYDDFLIGTNSTRPTATAADGIMRPPFVAERREPPGSSGNRAYTGRLAPYRYVFNGPLASARTALLLQAFLVGWECRESYSVNDLAADAPAWLAMVVVGWCWLQHRPTSIWVSSIIKALEKKRKSVIAGKAQCRATARRWCQLLACP